MTAAGEALSIEVRAAAGEAAPVEVRAAAGEAAPAEVRAAAESGAGQGRGADRGRMMWGLLAWRRLTSGGLA
jgi:hypothetical protein